MIKAAPARSKNHFLNSLPEEDFKRIQPFLEMIEMPLKMPVYASFSPIKEVYFPETAVISVLTVLENGLGVETGVIGRESICGLETVLSQDVLPREAMVQSAGIGWRMNAVEFKKAFDESKTFSKAVLEKVFDFIKQISQNSVCLCHHVMEKRLARWLLMFDDRVDGNVLNLTQEFIAMMIGVQRPSLSKCAAKLQESGFIKYNRGQITILDRNGMENFSCECYQTIKTDRYN